MTVNGSGHHLPPSMHAQELVRDLMRSTPNLPALNGYGCFLPMGASVGWDCEKIELRTAETRSNRGAVIEHLRLRQWVYDTIQELNTQNGAYTSVEMSCGGACYATGKTFGTHFNVDLQNVNRPAISHDLAALYLIGLPFHGSGALKFGAIVPCWSAHIEQRGVQRLFGFKDMRDAGKCRLQIATSAGCSRSPLSLALGFGWLTLIAAALEEGLSSAEIPQFNDLEAAGRTRRPSNDMLRLRPKPRSCIRDVRCWAVDCLTNSTGRVCWSMRDSVSRCPNQATRFQRSRSRERGCAVDSSLNFPITPTHTRADGTSWWIKKSAGPCPCPIRTTRNPNGSL